MDDMVTKRTKVNERDAGAEEHLDARISIAVTEQFKKLVEEVARLDRRGISQYARIALEKVVKEDAAAAGLDFVPAA